MSHDPWKLYRVLVSVLEQSRLFALCIISAFMLQWQNWVIWTEIMAHKAWNISYLALYGTHLLVSSPVKWRQGKNSIKLSFRSLSALMFWELQRKLFRTSAFLGGLQPPLPSSLSANAFASLRRKTESIWNRRSSRPPHSWSYPSVPWPHISLGICPFTDSSSLSNKQGYGLSHACHTQALHGTVKKVQRWYVSSQVYYVHFRDVRTEA